MRIFYPKQMHIGILNSVSQLREKIMKIYTLDKYSKDYYKRNPTHAARIKVAQQAKNVISVCVIIFNFHVLHYKHTIGVLYIIIITFITLLRGSPRIVLLLRGHDLLFYFFFCWCMPDDSSGAGKYNQFGCQNLPCSYIDLRIYYLHSTLHNLLNVRPHERQGRNGRATSIGTGFDCHFSQNGLRLEYALGKYSSFIRAFPI